MLLLPREQRAGAQRSMVEFKRRLFPERRYRLPLKWVLLGVMAGMIALVFWAYRTFFS